MQLYRLDLPRPSAWPPPSDGPSIAATLRFARHRDPYGHLAHTILAAVHAFTLPFAHSPAGISFAVVAIYAALRLPHTWRCYTALLRQPLFWLLLAFAGWYSLSVLWSSDQPQGLDEMGALRMLALPIILWPVLDRVVWLIGAVLLGVFAHNVVQFGQHFQVMGLEPKDAGRVRGMLHPIQTGAWCAAAVCWHLSAVLRQRGIVWWLSIAGLFAALAGLIIAGSRGPWIAVLLVIPIGFVLIALRRVTMRRTVIMLGCSWLSALLSQLHTRASTSTTE